jgi:hypothetical protein
LGLAPNIIGQTSFNFLAIKGIIMSSNLFIQTAYLSFF